MAKDKMEIAIEYCVTWNYVPQAVSLSEAIMDAFGEKFGALKLIPSDGGRFEITLDGDLIYSKLKTGDFPENEAILEQLRARM